MTPGSPSWETFWLIPSSRHDWIRFVFPLQRDLVSLFTTHLSIESRRGIFGLVSGCPKGVTGTISQTLQLGTQERNGTLLSAQQMLGKVACAALERRVRLPRRLAVAQTDVSEPSAAMSVQWQTNRRWGKTTIRVQMLSVSLQFFYIIPYFLLSIYIL